MILSIGWYKDKWLDIENIYISANDRGLKFGDGIFETVLIKNNNAVLIDEHIPVSYTHLTLPTNREV